MDFYFVILQPNIAGKNYALADALHIQEWELVDFNHLTLNMLYCCAYPLAK